MTHVIRKEVVARSLKRLREQETHALFAGYLHLQQRSMELNRLTDLQPKFLKFFKDYFEVPNHPLGAPYIRLFTEQKPSDANLWLNANVAGSYAPSSLRPNQPFRRVVDINDNLYSLPEDHAVRALEHLLFNKPVLAADLAIFLYRDFGLEPGMKVSDLVGVFAFEWGYASSELAAPNLNFQTIFCSDFPENEAKEWLQPQ